MAWSPALEAVRACGIDLAWPYALPPDVDPWDADSVNESFVAAELGFVGVRCDRRRPAAPEPKTLRLYDSDHGYSGTTLYGVSEAGSKVANTCLQKNL